MDPCRPMQLCRPMQRHEKVRKQIILWVCMGPLSVWVELGNLWVCMGPVWLELGNLWVVMGRAWKFMGLYGSSLEIYGSLWVRLGNLWVFMGPGTHASHLLLEWSRLVCASRAIVIWVPWLHWSFGRVLHRVCMGSILGPTIAWKGGPSYAGTHKFNEALFGK